MSFTDLPVLIPEKPLDDACKIECECEIEETLPPEPKPDPQLRNWENWLKIRKDVHKYLGEHLERQSGDLLMNAYEDYRSTKEEKQVFDHINILHPPDPQRGSPAFWKTPISLPSKCNRHCPTEYQAQLSYEEKCEVPNIEYTKVPNMIKKQKGVFPKSREGYDVWSKSSYKQEKYMRAAEKISSIQPHKPDLEELMVTGIPLKPPKREIPIKEIPAEETPFEAKLRALEDPRRKYLFVVNYVGVHTDQTGIMYHKLHFEYNISSNRVKRKTIKLENHSASVVRLHFSKFEKTYMFRDLMPRQKNKEQVFFFVRNEQILVPDSIKIFTIIFKATNPGTYLEYWRLKFCPNIFPDLQVVLVLQAFAAYTDRATRCLDIKHQLENNVKRHQIEQIFKQHPGPEPIIFTYDKKKIFEAINSFFDPYHRQTRYLYNKDVVTELEEFYEKIRLPKHPQVWNLNLLDLRAMTKEREIVDYELYKVKVAEEFYDEAELDSLETQIRVSDECLKKTTCQTKETLLKDKEGKEKRGKDGKDKYGKDKHGKGKHGKNKHFEEEHHKQGEEIDTKDKVTEIEQKIVEEDVKIKDSALRASTKCSTQASTPVSTRISPRTSTKPPSNKPKIPWKYSIELENIIKKLKQPVVGPNVEQEKYEFVYSILSVHFDHLCHEIDDLKTRLGIYQATTYPNITGKFDDNPRLLMEEKNMSYRKVLKDYGFYPPRGDAKRPDYLDEIPLENYVKRYKLYFGILDEAEGDSRKQKSKEKKGKKGKKGKKDKLDEKKSKKSEGKRSDGKKDKSKGKKGKKSEKLFKKGEKKMSKADSGKKMSKTMEPEDPFIVDPDFYPFGDLPNKDISSKDISCKDLYNKDISRKDMSSNRVSTKDIHNRRISMKGRFSKDRSRKNKQKLFAESQKESVEPIEQLTESPKEFLEDTEGSDGSSAELPISIVYQYRYNLFVLFYTALENMVMAVGEYLDSMPSHLSLVQVKEIEECNDCGKHYRHKKIRNLNLIDLRYVLDMELGKTPCFGSPYQASDIEVKETKHKYIVDEQDSESSLYTILQGYRSDTDVSKPISYPEKVFRRGTRFSCEYKATFDVHTETSDAIVDPSWSRHKTVGVQQDRWFKVKSEEKLPCPETEETADIDLKESKDIRDVQSTMKMRGTFDYTGIPSSETTDDITEEDGEDDQDADDIEEEYIEDNDDIGSNDRESFLITETNFDIESRDDADRNLKPKRIHKSKQETLYNQPVGDIPNTIRKAGTTKDSTLNDGQNIEMINGGLDDDLSKNKKKSSMKLPFIIDGNYKWKNEEWQRKYKMVSDEPEMKEEPDVKTEPELKEEPKMEEKPEIKEDPKMKEHPEIIEGPKMEEYPKMKEKSAMKEEPEIERDAKEGLEINEEPKMKEVQVKRGSLLKRGSEVKRGSEMKWGYEMKQVSMKDVPMKDAGVKELPSLHSRNEMSSIQGLTTRREISSMQVMIPIKEISQIDDIFGIKSISKIKDKPILGETSEKQLVEERQESLRYLPQFCSKKNEFYLDADDDEDF